MSTPAQQKARRKREPEKVRARDRLWASKNAEKIKVKNARSYEITKQQQRRYYLKRYGLTTEQHDLMLSQQKGNCAACGSPPGKRALAIDHCHETGLVRGLLCIGCNTALGSLKEDPLRMRALEAYINRFEWLKI